MSRQTCDSLRENARDLTRRRLYAEAAVLWEELIAIPARGPAAADDIRQAARCLTNLDRDAGLDALLEKAEAAAAGDAWALLAIAAAWASAKKEGGVKDGGFLRGHHPGFEFAFGHKGDCARVRRCLETALTCAPPAGARRGAFCLTAAEILLQAAHFSGDDGITRMVNFTALGGPLPGPESRVYLREGGRLPLDPATGLPDPLPAPADWSSAESDAGRWRWLLDQAFASSRSGRARAAFMLGEFWEEQLGTGKFLQHDYQYSDTTAPDALLALRAGLTDDQGLVEVLGTPCAVTLPAEMNPLRWWQVAASEGSKRQRLKAWKRIAEEREARAQFAVAAAAWREVLAAGPGKADAELAAKSLCRIEEPWVSFDPATTCAGEVPKVVLRSRNTGMVSLRVRRLDLETALTQIPEFLRKCAAPVGERRIHIESFGAHLRETQVRRYFGPVLAEWTETVTRAEDHWDTRQEVTLRLAPGHSAENQPVPAGGYLVEAWLEGKHHSSLLVWVADLICIFSEGRRAGEWFVADAVTGAPVADASLACIGYQSYRSDSKVVDLSLRTDDAGLAAVTSRDLNGNYQWLAIVRAPDGRLGFHGFLPVSWGRQIANELKGRDFVVTSQTAYRPGQRVKWKTWGTRSGYAPDADDAMAGEAAVLQITGPSGQILHETPVVLGPWGDASGEWDMPEDAALGSYRIGLARTTLGLARRWFGGFTGGAFRVEEYRKPEFEVDVCTPEDPVLHGSPVTVKVKARYYFGEPVSRGTARCLITVQPADCRWFPPTSWDWLFGPGAWFWNQHPKSRAHEYSWEAARFDARQGEVLLLDTILPLDAAGEATVELPALPAPALKADGWRCRVVAEVTDESRRTTPGAGEVIVATQPFFAYVWPHRGFVSTGDELALGIKAVTLGGKGVAGVRGTLRILPPAPHPAEQALEFPILTDDDGCATVRLVPSAAGHWRAELSLTHHEFTANAVHGLTVIGAAAADAPASGTGLEIIPERAHYQPGESVRLCFRAPVPATHILVRVRPENVEFLPGNGIVLTLTGTQAMMEVPVLPGDQPNFFVEAWAVARGRVHHACHQILVPPERKRLTLSLTPDQRQGGPGDRVRVKLRLTDAAGAPATGQAAVLAVDKSLEFIGGPPPVLLKAFWGRRKSYYPHSKNSVMTETALAADDDDPGPLTSADQGDVCCRRVLAAHGGRLLRAYSAEMPQDYAAASISLSKGGGVTIATAGGAGPREDPLPALQPPPARAEFADSALWEPEVLLDAGGAAEVGFVLPDNLTTWRIYAWAVDADAAVGEAMEEIISGKDVIIRLQAPRFFQENDTVLLCANVHHFGEGRCELTVSLDTGHGPVRLTVPENAIQRIVLTGPSEQRVEWLARVAGGVPAEGTRVTLRASAAGAAGGDAVNLTFPVNALGRLLTTGWSRTLGLTDHHLTIPCTVPAERDPGQTRLRVTAAATLTGVILDAVPYLADFRWRCTEQTLNRFLGAVLARHVLAFTGVTLEDIRKRLTPPGTDAAQPLHVWTGHPVFDEARFAQLVTRNLEQLRSRQTQEGAWSWFEGERTADVHLTGLIVRGLRTAENAGQVLPSGMIRDGEKSLTRWMGRRVAEIQAGTARPAELDAWVAAVVPGGQESEALARAVHAVRDDLSPGTLLHLAWRAWENKKPAEAATLLREAEQFMETDEANQSACLRMGRHRAWLWWLWHSCEVELHAWWLKLLCRMEPGSEKTARAAKHLISLRQHATRWRSTRDTALCIEALGEYVQLSGESASAMKVAIDWDGEPLAAADITPANVFTAAATGTLLGEAVSAGPHQIGIGKSGMGRLYASASLTVFSREPVMAATSAGLSVGFRLWHLPAGRQRVQLKPGPGAAPCVHLHSGECMEAEFTLTVPHDCEYLLLEVPRPAGCEALDVRSGWVWSPTPAYRELRDDRIAFFFPHLSRGAHTIHARWRAEIPGRYTALPATLAAMYAPELCGSSASWGLEITDPPRVVQMDR